MKTASELITVPIRHICFIALLVLFISSGSCLAVGLTLTIDPRPTGGTVTSSVGGINCGTGGQTCSATFIPNTQVTLTATPASINYTFESWNVGQSTSTVNPVTIPMIQNISGSVTFTYNPPVNGVCGSDNGIGVSPAPVNLCDKGTPSDVTGSGPWEWSCQGQLNGTDVTCRADILTFSPFEMQEPTRSHSSTLLHNGKLLVVGGNTMTGPTNKAATYDPSTNSWSSAGNLATVRSWHAATMLPNGKVLVSGGWGASAALATAEIYDPSDNSWSSAASMSVPRSYHTATLLADGRVLVAGGMDGSNDFASAEVYDFKTDTWTPIGNMAATHAIHAAVLLSNGMVLVTGGNYANSPAELYNPGNNSWTPAGSMSSVRTYHSATVLPNGKVLVAGGFDSVTRLGSSELYNPVSNSWTTTGSMITPRSHHTASLLPNGTLLVVGGYDSTPTFIASAELFDPASGTWSSAGSMPQPRCYHTATVMPDGTVAIVGGGSNGGLATKNERYNPAVAGWSMAGSMAMPHKYHTATPLPDGRVLVAGGRNTLGSYLSAAELYDPAANIWSAAADMAGSRQYHTATLLTNGKVLVTGGYNGSYLASAELYDPVTNSWAPAGSLITARKNHTATLLPDGRVLIAGGDNGIVLYSSELYDPATNSWSAAGNLDATGRNFQTATLLSNGKVLVAGNLNAYSHSAELYDPATNSWSLAGNLVTARQYHTATLLPNGRVLVAGGYAGGYLSSAELYDPVTNSWSAAGSLATARQDHAATLLPNGKVLVTGGLNGNQIAAAELYDPATNSWSAAGSMTSTGANYVRSTLLHNGKVLVTVGQNVSGGNISPAELYDPGLNFPETRRPVVTGMAFDYVLPNMLTVSGNGLRGDSDASAGDTPSSSTGYPLLHLQRIDNDQSMFLSPNPIASWSDTVFYSTPIRGLPAGHYRATVHVNGIPSLAQTVLLKGYNVKFTAGAGGTISGVTPQYVFPGVPSSPVQANPADTYQFRNWTGDNGFATTSENPLVITGLSDTNITANFARSPIEGACGSAHQAFSATKPASNLCAVGTASTVAGSGPWSWTCSALTMVNCATNAEPTLRVTLAGSGSGSVTVSSTQGNTQCLSGTCPRTFPYLTAISLEHTASALSAFGGWSGACSTPTGNCAVLMNGDKPVTATFNVADRARIGSTGFASVSLAYGSVTSTATSTITALDADLAEALTMDQLWNIILWGGWKGDYSATSGLPTVLHGLTVGKGSLEVKGRVAIK